MERNNRDLVIAAAAAVVDGTKYVHVQKERNDVWRCDGANGMEVSERASHGSHRADSRESHACQTSPMAFVVVVIVVIVSVLLPGNWEKLTSQRTDPSRRVISVARGGASGALFVCGGGGREEKNNPK